jgi:hypothetical protein
MQLEQLLYTSIGSAAVMAMGMEKLIFFTIILRKFLG